MPERFQNYLIQEAEKEYRKIIQGQEIREKDTEDLDL